MKFLAISLIEKYVLHNYQQIKIVWMHKEPRRFFYFSCKKNQQKKQLDVIGTTAKQCVMAMLVVEFQVI